MPVVRPDLDTAGFPYPTGWALSCAVQPTIAKDGKPFAPLIVVAKNTTAARRTEIVVPSPFLVWLVHNGRDVPLTPLGKLSQVRERYPGHFLNYDKRIDADVEPGGTQSETIELTDLFVIPEPGHYLVFVTWVGEHQQINAVAATSFDWPR